MDWVSYWNGSPTVYVSARHQNAHDLDIALTAAQHIQKARGGRDAAFRVLDFGCGDATEARLVASQATELLLWDAAEAVRDRLRQRYMFAGKITVLTPATFEELPAGSVDLITVSSVFQYLQREQLGRTLGDFRRILSPDGTIVIADVIPPNIGVLQDAWQLLRFAYREGFAWEALYGLVRTATSDYRHVRQKLKLSKYSETEFLSVLKECGFEAQRLKRNFGHNQLRMAFEARSGSGATGESMAECKQLASA